MLKFVVIAALACISSASADYSTTDSSLCVENVDATHGSIQSPRYPESYLNNLDCYYTITTSDNTDVTLTIVTLDIESNYDYLYLYDGYTTHDALLGRFTGQHSNIIVYATTNKVLAYFHTDGSVVYTGFNITFQERARCGEVVFGTYGSISSPGYPTFPYPNNRDCIYKITTSPDTEVSYDIASMSLEPNYDYVDIFDGNSTTAPLIARYTGEQSRVINRASSNHITMHFHSDYSIQNAGFFISFTEIQQTACPAVIYNSTAGTISDPNLYPILVYPPSEDCLYLIYTTNGNAQFTLTFSSLDVDLSINCDQDYVEIFDGPTTSNQRLARVCGRGPAPPIVSSSNAVLAHFHSDSVSHGAYGFTIDYNTSACPTPINVTGNYGTISSPGYPLSNYPNYANCVYFIETPAGSQVFLHINSLKMEYGSLDCPFDNVLIFDGFETLQESLIAKLCGEMEDLDFNATTNKVRLEFNSDFSNNDRGFSITYLAAYNRDYQ